MTQRRQGIGVAPQNSLRSLRSLRSNNRGESEVEARCARRPGRCAAGARDCPLDRLEPGLNESAFYDPTNFTDPAGSCVCEIEVDPAAGRTKVERFTAVDDFGNIVNPLIVEGQVHGGLAQGLGQAMLEGCVYDTESGQLLTGSSMDYTMPRADDLPSFTVDHTVTACTHNPLGVKGCGEAGAIGSPAAFINALTDARGTRDIAMPAAAERVWRAADKKA